MRLQINKYDEDINSLIDLSLTIYDIYVNLDKFSNNEKMYNKYLEYLKIALESEDKIYTRYDYDLMSSDYFINRINYLLRRRDDIDEATKEYISSRIINYINNIFYFYPFTSLYETEYDQKLENDNIIRNRRNFEYLTLSLYYLNEAISEETNKKVKDLLISRRNEIYFTYKILNPYIFTSLPKPKTDGRETLIIFNHDEDRVNEIYQDSSSDIISNSIYEILCIGNKNSIENRVAIKLAIVDMKSALSQLNREECMLALKQFNSNIRKDPEYQELIEKYPEIYKELKNIIRNFALTNPKTLINQKNA